MDHFANVSDLECECIGWCRASITPLTNHHPNCPKYNDSLIDVWRIEHTLTGEFFYSDNKDAIEFKDEPDIKVTQERLHKEVYESMKEFQGF